MVHVQVKFLLSSTRQPYTCQGYLCEFPTNSIVSPQEEIEFMLKESPTGQLQPYRPGFQQPKIRLPSGKSSTRASFYSAGVYHRSFDLTTSQSAATLVRWQQHCEIQYVDGKTHYYLHFLADCANLTIGALEASLQYLQLLSRMAQQLSFDL